MELSGRLIKGTGNFVIGEIATFNPIYLNGRFETAASVSEVGCTPNTGDGAVSRYTTAPIQGDSSLMLKQTVISGNSIRPSITIPMAKTLKQYSYYRIKFKTKVLKGTPKISATNGLLLGGVPANGHESILKDYVLSGEESFDYTLRIEGTPVSNQVLIYFDGNTVETTDFELLIDDLTVDEIPLGYPVFDIGEKYLQATAAGTVAFPSNQAYGEWIFKFYRSDGSVNLIYDFISDTINSLNEGGNGYRFYAFSADNELIMSRYSNGSQTILFRTGDGAITDGKAYEIKITRTFTGIMSLYVRGSEYGDEWTLAPLLTGGSGSNPATDNAHHSSKYSVIDNDTDDFIGGMVNRNMLKI